ncbi:MAG: Pr6Pr family membrane protein [Sphingomicrobium sp.]
MARIGAAIIAIICWTGLAIQFHSSWSKNGDVLASLWILLRFFTILTNLLLALVMTRRALGGALSPFFFGGVTLAILLVGVVYVTLLEGTQQLSGSAHVADTLVHKVSPTVAVLYWLFCVSHGRLAWRAPFLWVLYPLAYFGYALARAAIDGHYPYPFIDVSQLGYPRVILNAAMITLAFVVTGLGTVALDRALGRRQLAYTAAS